MLQWPGDPASVQRQRNEAGRFPAKCARLLEGSSRDQHLMPFADKASSDPATEAAIAAIAAKDEDASHRMRAACSAVGIQHADLFPNNR